MPKLVMRFKIVPPTAALTFCADRVRAAKAAAILVTHDMDEAVYLGNPIVVMHPRPGRIAREIPVPEAARADRSSPEFVVLRDHVLEQLGVHIPHGPAAVPE